MRLNALFRLAFAVAPLETSLTLPHRVTSRLIMQKARRHPASEAPTACKYTVSGTFHSPNRGTFHLSLTVLVHYRSQISI